MGARSGFSGQTLSVLAVALATLRERLSQWRHGYALAQQAGLKSGTLYPILIRLADRGLIVAAAAQPGPPRRRPARPARPAAPARAAGAYRARGRGARGARGAMSGVSRTGPVGRGGGPRRGPAGAGRTP